MNMSRAAMAGSVAIMLSVLPAAAFVATNGVRVTPDGPRSFVVSAMKGKTATTDFWCSAGDFVIRGLHLRPSTRVYRMTTGSGKSGGIRFSLDPQGAVASGVSVFGAKDIGLSASLAQGYCTSMNDDFFFLR